MKSNPAQGPKWIHHFGESDPPIPGPTHVEIMYRDGTFGSGSMHFWDENWQWANSAWGYKSDGAIIAYRVVPSPKPKSVRFED